MTQAARNATLLERAKAAGGDGGASQRTPADFDSELERVFTTAATKDETERVRSRWSITTSTITSLGRVHQPLLYLFFPF